MKVYFATDHSGFELKEELLQYVQDELGHEVVDFGAKGHNPDDDYPVFIKQAAEAVSGDPTAKGIIVGASGQGEAVVANRFNGVRAVVYYGDTGASQVDAEGNEFEMIESTRRHNDANILSLGARFLDTDTAKQVVKLWLGTEFLNEDRHARRISQIDEK